MSTHRLNPYLNSNAQFDVFLSCSICSSCQIYSQKFIVTRLFRVGLSVLMYECTRQVNQGQQCPHCGGMTTFHWKKPRAALSYTDFALTWSVIFILVNSFHYMCKTNKRFQQIMILKFKLDITYKNILCILKVLQLLIYIMFKQHSDHSCVSRQSHKHK